MLHTPLGKRWIIVLADHLTRWQDALRCPIPPRQRWLIPPPWRNELSATLAFQRPFTPIKGQSVKAKSCTTPYRPPCSQGSAAGMEQDWLLLHIMRAMRATLHMTMKETTNYLILGRELRLIDELSGHPPPLQTDSTPLYAVDKDEPLSSAHATLRNQQLQTH